MDGKSKEEFIEEIQHLISVDGSSTEINPNYLEYFTHEELIEMRDELLIKKLNKEESTKEYVNELYEKLAI